MKNGDEFFVCNTCQKSDVSLDSLINHCKEDHCEESKLT